MKTYIRLDLRRMLRDPGTVIFAIIMPLGMYLLFGPLQDYSSEEVAHGNVGALIMASMGCYGALLAVTALAAESAHEQGRGWNRQLAMTPMTPGRYIAAKTIAIQLVAIAPIALVFIAGALTGARIDGWGWLTSPLLCWICTLPFSMLGLAVGMAMRSDSASNVASFIVVAAAFVGNAFSPLSGGLLKFAHWPPLFGPNLLARWPVAGGWIADGDKIVHDSVWWGIGGVLGWAVVFMALAFLASRRHQDR